MKIIAWNINGMRSHINKSDVSNLFNLIEAEKPTIICFSETKLSCPTLETENTMKTMITGYKYRYYSTCTNKSGYSGTAIYSMKKPINVIYGMGTTDLDQEGRLITLEFRKFYLIHVYTPNSGEVLVRLNYRVNTWDVAFKKYIGNLQKKKPIIVCGDLNVANEDIDIHNPKGGTRRAGFTEEERNSFRSILNDLDLIDTYRNKHTTGNEYSYWTYRMNARKKNKGWRIDYFLVSRQLLKQVKKAKILTTIMGSDHAPIKMNITFKDI